MEFQEIIYTEEEGIATITLNDPQHLNSLSPTMEREWTTALRLAKENPEVKVVIVTGAGRAFCAGANPRELAPSRETFLQTGKWGPGPDLAEQIRVALELDKPYIGAINGACVGGGWELTNLFDIRIASDKARFGTGFIRMGEIPAGLGCYILPRLIGIPKALEWLWTAKLIDAQEAYRIGYVNQVVPHEELMAAARSLALQLARGPSLAIREIRRLAYSGLSQTMEESLKAHYESSRIIAATEDAMEGPRAWVEKREPQFKGR